MSIFLDAIAALGALAGYLLPGYFLARALRLPAPWTAGFFLSLILLFHACFTLELFHAPLTPRNVAAVLLAVTVACQLALRRRRGEREPDAAARHPAYELGAALRGPLAPLAAIAALLATMVLALKCVALPLSGWDTYWRWNFIARVMLEEKTLAFYPAVTAGQMRLYPWFDGFPPLVPVAYWWAYALHGSAAIKLSAVFVILQALLAGTLVFRLGARLGGSPRAGLWALALATLMPVTMLAFLIGQETGLTTLSVLGVCFFLASARDASDWRAGLAAGCCAAVGGLAREYGLAFAAMGFVMLLVRRADARTLLAFSAAAAAALPWYLHNYWLHANPFGAFDFLGLFPANARNAEMMRIISRANSAWHYTPAQWAGLGRDLLLSSCALALPGLMVLLARPRTRLWLLVPAAGTALLFLQSIGPTNSTRVYAARVMAAGLLVCAAASGPVLSDWLARASRPARALAGACFLALLAWSLINAGSAPRMAVDRLPLQWATLFTPERSWETVSQTKADWLATQTRPGAAVITDQAYLFAHCRGDTRFRLVFFGSPEADFLWDNSLSNEQVHAAAAQRGIEGVLVDASNLPGLRVLALSRFLRNDPALADWIAANDGKQSLLLVPLGDGRKKP